MNAAAVVSPLNSLDCARINVGRGEKETRRRGKMSISTVVAKEDGERKGRKKEERRNEKKRRKEKEGGEKRRGKTRRAARVNNSRVSQRGVACLDEHRIFSRLVRPRVRCSFRAEAFKRLNSQ